MRSSRHRVAQPGDAQRQLHLLQRAAGGDARLPAGGAHAVDRLARTVDRSQLALERGGASRRGSDPPAVRDRRPRCASTHRAGCRPARRRGTRRVDLRRGSSSRRPPRSQPRSSRMSIAHAVDEHRHRSRRRRGAADGCKSSARRGRAATPRPPASGSSRARSRPARSRPAAARPLEVDDLVVARAAAQPRRVGARGALDEHVERAPDEALGALAGAPLDDLDEPLHALDLDLVRHLVGEASAASVPRRGEKMNVKAPS